MTPQNLLDLLEPEQPANLEVIPHDPKPESANDAPRPSAKATDKREVDPAHSAPVRGSDEGRAQGEAAGKEAAESQEPPAHR